MEMLGHIITILLISLVVFTPLYLVVKGYGIIKGLFIAIPLCLLFFVASAWLADILPDLRLTMMGYDFEGMNESERLMNVSPEQREEATKLYLSRFGVGWSLKAMLGMALFLIPYLVIVFAGATIWRKIRNKASNTASQQTLNFNVMCSKDRGQNQQ